MTDEYYNRAKQEGYRSRAAYKLKQLDREADLIAAGDTVVDLGAAPGGWLQVANKLAGESGTVVGVDRQRIDPIEGVETVRGDMTETSTRETVFEHVGEADLVVSDMAPDMTGEYELDHARSVHLARTAFETALELLTPGGDVVAKVFEGPDVDDLRANIDGEFEYVRSVHPEASRDASSELYLVGKGRLTAPVVEGDRLEVDVVDVGDERDGIAKVDGYTLFVPGTEAGTTVDVRVTDVKPRFGFAELVE
ncbi:23S rRNA (uridine(2552)-2'-O)-methyltransferase [Halobacteriales archaeon QS_1_69_70]|nr:MAG: 23S rRNA (uridine(2552)-2'-O)-methyltransferase [Halobacteriales archaeon QS_1_69_70]